MPRPNPVRTIGGESVLAARIKEERLAREWNLQNVADKMTALGCPLPHTAIFKIESGDTKTGKPRRITVDELVAFSQIFEVDIEDLVTPPSVKADRRLRNLVASWWDARRAMTEARQRLLRDETALRVHLRKNPESTELLLRELAVHAPVKDPGEAAGLNETEAAGLEEPEAVRVDEDEVDGLAVTLARLLTQPATSLTKDERRALDSRGTGEY